MGPTRPDKIELEKGLRRWVETSWFLDEAGHADVEADGRPTAAEDVAARLEAQPDPDAPRRLHARLGRADRGEAPRRNSRRSRP